MSRLHAPTLDHFIQSLSALGFNLHVTHSSNGKVARFRVSLGSRNRREFILPAFDGPKHNLLEGCMVKPQKYTIRDFVLSLPLFLAYDDSNGKLMVDIHDKRFWLEGKSAPAYVVRQGLLSLIPEEKKVLYVRWMIVVPTSGEPIYYSNAQYPSHPIYSGLRSNAQHWLSKAEAEETLALVHLAGHNPTARLRKVTTYLRRR